MKKAPKLYSVENIAEAAGEEVKQNQWYLARNQSERTLSNRIKLAWQVFTGKYDALRWPGNQ